MTNIFTAKKWLEIKRRLDEMAKDRVPTARFYNIQKTMDIVRDIMDETDRLSITYGYTNCTITWETALLALYDDTLDKFQQMIDDVDPISIGVATDETLCIEIMISGVFAMDIN